MTKEDSQTPAPSQMPLEVGKLPPHQWLMLISAAKWVAQPVHALAKLDVADHLAQEELSTRELAERLGVAANPLRRCLRAASSVGIFRETAPERWGLTDAAQPLRTDAPISLRDFTVLLGEAPMWEPFGRIMDVLHGDGPAFETTHQRSMYELLAAEPELNRVYQGAWAPLTAGVMHALTKSYDFTPYSSVADLGGGQGTALRILLQANPHLTGVLMDLPHTLQACSTDHGDVGDRITHYPGRLPEDVPPDIDLYLLKNTLHCLSPDLVSRTLERLREEIRHPRQRLIIVEAVVQPGNGFDWSKLMDVEVMVNNGGREHTLEEWRTSLAQCGFRLTAADEVLHPQWILEAAPA
ncbi:hypothetical protein NGM37_54810 [Streptomyces sp. TRM76130]|nr:hypothetical protein [Streptomyces sp. TRM76130]